jgi:hypothetical protein
MLDYAVAAGCCAEKQEHPVSWKELYGLSRLGWQFDE